MSQILIDNLFRQFRGDSTIQLVFEDKKALLSETPVINLSIHPIRFCEDIFFNFETNKNILYEKLKKYEVDYRIFYHYADCIRAKSLRHIKKIEIKKNSLLIIGQLNEDKAVFDGERYINIIDYSERINEMASMHTEVYYKPHPYLKSKKNFFRRIKKICPNVKMIKENIYILLSHPSFSTVAGINSSCLYEAKYFNKKVLFFYEKRFNFLNKDIGIYGDYFSSKFWSSILDIEDLGFKIPIYENMLRRIFSDYWGYTSLSTEIDLYASFKNCMQRYL